LYLTRPLMLGDDSETVASYYIDELARAIAPLRVETEIVRRDYDGKESRRRSTTTEMKSRLVRQQERHLHRGQKAKSVAATAHHASVDARAQRRFSQRARLRRIEIERERAGRTLVHTTAMITDPDLLHC
jgi:hypothetical protein